ncbi:MAG: SusC/RagA family TonB-linked outer membrane protein [Saprospiraceae bacterium]|nr:SusC/RagA family TonB-linked outer membrane protein [Saprospiraceae bacterium]
MLLAFAAGSSLYGQYSVTGTVTDSEGAPLIGVSVLVKGSPMGASTDLDGNFSLELTDASTLEFSYIGYATQDVEVSSDNNSLQIVMLEDVNKLDEVVITGLASSIKRSNLANSVASIGAQELAGITTQSTMDGALYGKLKGAEIRSNSGAPGGGMSVKLRGVTSIFGDQQPLYIVDGIFVDNSTISLGTNIVSAAAGGGNTSTNQDDASNRISDLVTEDIENIEVLKGASAAAIYGSRAAGGVVIITTKRGKSGEPRVQFNQTFGLTSPIKLLGQRVSTVDEVRTIFGEDAAAEAAINGVNDYEAALYDNSGLLSTSQLSYSGGNDQTTFYISGLYKDEEGIVENTGYKKASVRANIDHKFNDWFDISFSSNYITSTADRGFFNNGNTNTTIGYALAFTSPWENLFADENGNFPAGAAGSNVLETVNKITNRENVNRFLNSIRANIRLFSNDRNNLRLALTAGRDEYTLQTIGLFPQELSFFRDPSSLGGVSINGNTINEVYNLNAFLIHSFYTDNDITFRTQLGLTTESFDQNTVITTATDLNGAQTNVDQAANVGVFQNRREQRDKGFFIQEEVNFQDKIIGTIGLRGDKSSNNGDADKLYYYPKASVAVNLHEMMDFNGFLNTTKVRVAYGESGRFANFNDRFNAMNGTIIGSNAGLVTSTVRGNSEVGPERQKELELGFDMTFLDNRAILEFTHYRKSVTDVLLRAQVPTSTGFTTQVVNGAELANSGFEVSLGLSPVQGKVQWDTQLNWWKNTSEVTRLDVPAFNLGGFAASLGQYRIEEGKSATQIVGTVKADDVAELDPDGDGFAVYGNAEADFNLGWVNSIKVGNWDMGFVFHWKKGGDGVNLSTLLWDLAGMTWDYDDTTLDPSGTLGNGDYRTSEWFAGNAGPWIEDASYIRLREVGVYYTITREKLSNACDLRIGVSGRNLINIFDYNSYDPEVSNFGGNVLANSIEVTPFPSSKRMNFHVTATF